MKQLKKTLLTLVALLLTAVTGAWADQLASSYSSNATLNAVTVSASMEVTIATGVTVTINNGLNVTSGTLTVTGPGTLVVNGAKGNNGASGWEGSNGGNGGVAISGNIIVQGGATVTATGGKGGNGGSGALEAGTGGTGGNAFAGTLTYKSGTVTANGGSAGSGGYIDDEEKYASSGSAGKAFANDVDFTQTTGYSVTDGTSTIGSVLNQTKVVISGGTDPSSASSGPEVAWDKAEKTGTFKMPGGNVTLEPEYYPQAALTAAPTAINDVPATTDGAIVKAGTVKNIGETTTAQGTVMYYVSPTALDDAALLALAADKWTADVPTAAGLAQGQAYVYYYVRGNDGDTDDEIFSDGDILAANALTVTIAAEPTYAVTFADGVNPEPPAQPEWTASPAADVKKGQTVTVTYTGSKKVIGVKAEKKAAAGIVNPVVGQIIGSDGKNYDANATLPSGVTAVAKIAYVGNDAETSTTYNHGLALALGDVSDKKAWCSQYQKTCLTTQYGSADAAKGDMAGIANTDALVNHTGHSHAAASAARDYNGGTHPMGTSEWFLPSAGQWDKMASAAGGYVKLRTNAGLQSDYYWSSTERDASYAWYFSSHNGDWLKDYKDMYSHRVRACLAF